MAILLTVIMLVTNTLPVAAAEDSMESAPTTKPTAVLTIETVGEGTVECTGDGLTETGTNTYSVSVGTNVTVKAQPTEGSTWKQTTLNGSEVQESFAMPETDSTLQVVFETLPKEEIVVDESQEEKPQELQSQEEASVEEVKEGLPTEDAQAETESIPTEDAEEYVTNSKGIKVKKSLLCEDPNCLEEHVGASLDPTTFPVQEASIPMSQLFSNSEERILEDVYVGMQTSGSNAEVAFWGTPGTGGVHDVRINDGGLAGVTGSGYCINHGAANPGEGFWQKCTYVAECTAVEGTTATWKVTMTPPGAWDGESFVNGLPAGYQRVGMNVRVRFEEAKGNLEVRKSSAKPEITNGNSNYSLQGAVYGLFQSGKEVARATTNEYGVASFNNLKKGNYVLKEITAPKGYALDQTSYNVSIVSGTTVTKQVTDMPLTDPVVLLLGKVDAETNANKPQGSASLKDAEFTVKYYATQSATDPALAGLSPMRTWVLKTDKDGYTRLDEKFKVSGDPFFLLDGVATLPLGTLTIQETKAPTGYLLNPEVFVRQITLNGAGNGILTYNMPTVPETVQKGVIQLEKQSNEADIGNATLKGAEYEVRNAQGTVVDTLVTDAQGKAQSKELPYKEGYINLHRQIFHKQAFKKLKANEKYLLFELLKRTHENSSSYHVGTRKFYSVFTGLLGVTERVIRYYLHNLRKFFSVGIKNGQYWITYMHSVFHEQEARGVEEQEFEFYIQSICRRDKVSGSEQEIHDTARLIKQYRPRYKEWYQSTVEQLKKDIATCIHQCAERGNKLLSAAQIHKMLQQTMEKAF